MKKQERVEKLIQQCKELLTLRRLQEEKTKKLRENANLARQGLLDTSNYQFDNTVVDFTDVINQIIKTVKYL